MVWLPPYQKVRDVVQHCLEQGHMEDRQEYTRDELLRAYGPGTPAGVPETYIDDLYVLIRAYGRFDGTDEEFARGFLKP